MKRKLVDYLVNAEVVERSDIQRCVLRASMDDNGSVVDEIADRLDVDQHRLAEVMAEFWGLDVWNGDGPVDLSRLDFVDDSRIRDHGVLPVAAEESGPLRVVVYDVEKARPLIEEIRDHTGTAPVLMLGARERVEQQLQGQGGGEAEVGSRSDSAPGQGVMRKGRRRRPQRTTANTPAGTNVERTETKPSAQAEPTRQVSVESDNPFMDLVGNSGGGGEKTREFSEDPPPTRVMDATTDPDFFSDIDDDDDQSGSEAVQRESGESDAGELAEPSSEPEDLAGALDEFDEQLADESEPEPEFAGAPSEVDWGEYRGNESAFPGLDVESSNSEAEQAATMTPKAPGFGEGGDSGVFPLEDRSGGAGFFDFPDAEDRDELTLAEVVDRQRRMIGKLEREIEYQKGILQTMAELLVEARVISKRKLKTRLKAFKEEQRRRHQDD